MNSKDAVRRNTRPDTAATPTWRATQSNPSPTRSRCASMPKCHGLGTSAVIVTSRSPIQKLTEPLHGPAGRQSRLPLSGGPSQRSYSMDRSSPGHRMSNNSPPTPHRSPVLGDSRRGQAEPMRKPIPQQQHLDPSSAMRRNKQDKMDSMLRNDSLSSDQSESVRPPRPHLSKRLGKLRTMGSFSSSEEELATTPEYTSCEDVELESESISEKGKRC